MSRVTEKQSLTRDVEIVKSVLCDRCGAECLSKPGRIYERSGTMFEGNFGYGSSFDNEGWRIDLCDECCEWLRDQLREGVDVNAY